MLLSFSKCVEKKKLLKENGPGRVCARSRSTLYIERAYMHDKIERKSERENVRGGGKKL